MINLAGDKGCNKIIRYELKEAGIEVVKHRIPLLCSEVPAKLHGKLGPFTFKRAWYYWVVIGDVPLKVAEYLYADPIGKTDIRVAGHCGCPPPTNWAFPKGVELSSQLDALDIGFLNYRELAELCNTGKIVGPRYVDLYHIDSQGGLNIFAATMKQYLLGESVLRSIEEKLE